MALFNIKNLSEKKTTNNKSYSILLVDDEEDNLNAISAILANDYQLLTAHNGEEALAILNDVAVAKNIKLIISDQRMPKMTGVELFEHVADCSPNIVRIIVTGFMDVNAIIDSVNKAHIYRFILKPFDRQDFLLTVQRAIEAFEMQEQITLHQENLEVKVANRTQELQETHDKLNGALLKMGHQAESLKKLNEDKDKFLAILSHDLRGPLGSLHMMTDLLADKVDSLDIKQGAEIVYQINDLTVKIQKLLEQMLQWSRVNTGHIECNPQSVKPHELIKDTIEMYTAPLEKHQIKLNNEMDSEQVLWADPDMLLAIFRNLLSNAIKFTPEQGEVTVSIRSAQEVDTIAFANTGSYMSPPAIDKLFRLDSKSSQRGKRGEKGAGLGLLLCKEYIDKHQGEIYATSDEDKGTCFYVSFPNEVTVSSK